MELVQKTLQYFGLARRRHAGGGVSLVRQAGELAYLRFFNGIRANEYYAAGLDARMPLREKREYLMGEPYLRLLRRANPEEYKFVVMHKVAAYGVLASLGVPCPRFLGVASARNGWAHDGKPLRNAEDLGSLLDRSAIDAVWFKPIGLWGGSGFSKFSLVRGGPRIVFVREPDGTRLGVDDVWHGAVHGGNGPEYICQQAVIQRAELAALHPWSVNTARIWAFQADPGNWEVFAALLRMGVGKSVVDNTSAGGIAAAIDLRTGRLGAATDEGPERTTFVNHPTTGERIEGFTVPMWNEAIELSTRAAGAFPYFRLLGLDIAFGDAGPLVIELECEPSPQHQITFGRGVRSLLGDLAARGPIDWRGVVAR